MNAERHEPPAALSAPAPPPASPTLPTPPSRITHHALRITHYGITHHASRITPYALLAALTLLGLFLRRYRLAAEGLWFDEADLVARAQQPLGELLTSFVRPGENGPLYTLLMATWLRLAGDGELAARLPAVLAGTLAIPALGLLGRALGGWRVGLLAAGLLTVSPYAIWYSRDAKMYALLLLMVPTTWGLLLLALRRGRWSWWLAYAGLTAIGFVIHVSSLLVWLSQALVVLAHWPRLGRARWPWLGATLLLLLPELVVGLWRTTYLLGDSPLDSWQPAVGLAEMLTILAVKLAVNRGDPASETWGAGLLVGLAALGLVVWATGRVGSASAPPARPPLRPALLLAVAVAVPVLGFFLLSLRVPLFQDRYLIVVLPAYLLLAAGGLAWLAGRVWPLGLVGLAALLALTWPPLRDVVYAAEPQREDWRGAYRYIGEHAREGDIVLVHPGYLRTTADYYARRGPGLARLPIVTLPSPRATDFGERELDMALADLTGGKTRVWLVTSPERLTAADDLLQRWYEGNTLRFADRRFNGVRVQTFSYNGPFKAGLWRPELPLRVDFADQITLLGATWDLPGPNQTVPAGDWALLTLRWRAQQPLTTAYVVRVRLRDAAGREVAAYDIPPLDGHHATTRWSPRDQVWDYHDLFIPADLPPGPYTVAIGLYPPDRPTAGLRPGSDAAADDPLAVVVGRLNVVRPAERRNA